jgi:hypothetical protein
MFRFREAVAVVLIAFITFAPRNAPAATKMALPSGGGLGPLNVTVDLASGSVSANGLNVPIGLQHDLLPPAAEVVIEDVPIGQGKHVAHVRIPEKDAGSDGPAWEAILAAGRSEPIFAGRTGLVTGDPGERRGSAVQIVPKGGVDVVVIGDLREEVNICGRTDTLLEPRGLDANLKLRNATFQRLSPQQIAEADQLSAIDKGHVLDAPLAQLLRATHSSVGPDSVGNELADSNPATMWTEQRPSTGYGEFVLMAAPKDVPISRMEFVVTPPNPSSSAASPTNFYLVTSSQTFVVDMPADGYKKPGQAYAIDFPTPIQTSCLALVLGDAYARGLPNPDVGVAELVAYSEFDQPGASLADVAKQLSGNRGEAAKALLQRAGPAALAAVEGVYDKLDEQGKARAIDVAASHPRCEEAAPLFAQGLCEPHGQASRKSRLRLEGCKGAGPALEKKLREDATARACIAPTLAGIEHDKALVPLADVMASTPEEDHDTRQVLRAAFSQALDPAEASATALGALLSDPHRSLDAKLEMLRAAGSRVTTVPAESESALGALLQGEPPMRLRYLTLGPLAELAHAGDHAAAERIGATLAHDRDWPVRWLAAKLAAGLAEAQAALLAAARDPEPRVREEALGALATTFVPGSDAAARAGLEDGWSFVREQSVRVLEKAPPSGAVDDALAMALKDSSVRVRAGALTALATRRATSKREAIRARLDDKSEGAEVRAQAARALGAVCDASAIDRLTELAHGLGVPGQTEDEQLVALGALQGLAALQPHDLRARIASLLGPASPPPMKQAAEKALAVPGLCRR